MVTKQADKTGRQRQAGPGKPTEVTWDQGSGRQPFANQEDVARDEPAAAPAAPEGDRGELSGRNQEQLAQVRKKP